MISLPGRFWEDKEWIFAHYSELLRTYKNMWIAVLSKKIIAASPNLGKVEELKAKTGKEHIPVIFLEDGSHVHQYQSDQTARRAKLFRMYFLSKTGLLFPIFKECLH